MIYKKTWLSFILIACLFCTGAVTGFPQNAAASGASDIRQLQELIERATPGETVKLPGGIYEGKLSIDKSVHVIAEEDVHIVNKGNEPAITVYADHVRIEGLRITQDSKEESAAVLVSSKDNQVSGLKIETRTFGIMLRDAERNDISNNQIVWLDDPSRPAVKMSEKRNGIDLYQSNDNRIEFNEVAGMNDGIYLESSHRNLVENNRVDHSRYGIHCMYTEGTVVRDNSGKFNITGAMIMGVQGAEVSGNTFVKQSESVNSQGLLLFDVQTSRIHSNKVEGNRVGLYIEQSQENEFWNNDVNQNFIGIQLLESDGNRFSGNRFIANVIEAEATDSIDNELHGNFWDSFRGIDTDKDGLSDISYGINPFFQRLTADTPAYQLFFQSPGMVFLESMLASGRAEWTTDISPLMGPGDSASEAAGSSNDWRLAAISLLLLGAATTIILLAGVRKS